MLDLYSTSLSGTLPTQIGLLTKMTRDLRFNSNSFHGYQYSPSVANIFTDTDLKPVEEWHPRIPNVVYWVSEWDLGFVSAY